MVLLVQLVYYPFYALLHRAVLLSQSRSNILEIHFLILRKFVEGVCLFMQLQQGIHFLDKSHIWLVALIRLCPQIF